MRPLQHGEVGVSFLTNGGEREILLEPALRLVDRTLNAGDFCKRNIDDVCSGVVTNLHVRGRVEHAITGEQVEGWWTMDDLWHKADADIGDHAIYDDWIGQVSKMSWYR
jgi:ubiquitin-conjugating enzyme E2 O